MASHFKQSYVDDRDYETQASPMAADSITKISSGQGVRRLSAKPRISEKRSEAKKGVLIGVALAALLVIVGGFLLVRALLGEPAEEAAPEGEAIMQDQQQAEVTIDTETGVVESEGITFMGETITMVNIEGTAAVVSTDELGYQYTLFKLTGLPVTMLFYNGTIIVPENLPDGWDVICYVIGGESPASPIVEDGEAVKGTGEIVDAYLDGSELVVVDSNGTSTRLAL